MEMSPLLVASLFYAVIGQLKLNLTMGLNNGPERCINIFFFLRASDSLKET